MKVGESVTGVGEFRFEFPCHWLDVDWVICQRKFYWTFFRSFISIEYNNVYCNQLSNSLGRDKWNMRMLTLEKYLFKYYGYNLRHVYIYKLK